MSSALQVAGFCSAAAVVLGVATWRRCGPLRIFVDHDGRSHRRICSLGKDAAKDVTQARRAMPIHAAVAFAVATVLVEVALRFHTPPRDMGDPYDWRIASAYVFAVLFSAGLIARGRRAALGVA